MEEENGRVDLQALGIAEGDPWTLFKLLDENAQGVVSLEAKNRPVLSGENADRMVEFYEVTMNYTWNNMSKKVQNMLIYIYIYIYMQYLYICNI